jgi:hypothetical protein
MLCAHIVRVEGITWNTTPNEPLPTTRSVEYDNVCFRPSRATAVVVITWPESLVFVSTCVRESGSASALFSTHLCSQWLGRGQMRGVTVSGRVGQREEGVQESPEEEKLEWAVLGCSELADEI